MEKHRPLVKTPRLIGEGKITPKWREGRGFSLPELKEAGITLDLAKKLGIYVDRRRRSKHEKNVEYLKSILKNLRKQES